MRAPNFTSEQVLSMIGTLNLDITLEQRRICRQMLMEMLEEREILRNRINRTAEVEEQLLKAGRGKRELPTQDECLVWGLRIGTPKEGKK